MPKELPPVELLRKLLRYDPETGRLFWLPRPPSMFSTQRSANSWNARFAGREALTSVGENGYQTGQILRVFYKAHRVAWAIHEGKSPANFIDHINGIKSDNRFCNLREATKEQNGMNLTLRSNNTSGVKGVSRHKRSNKWVARVRAGGVRLWLGEFALMEDAEKACRDAREKHHGHFARHA